MADLDRRPEETDNPKKRQKLGRKWEKERDERLSSHVMGPSCECKRLRCFEVTSDEERNFLLSHFNDLKNKDKQDSMLTSMIAVQLVKRRRPRQGEDAASLHDYSYRYSVRVKRGETAIPIQVCIKALVSIFGIGTARLERVRASLAKTGLPSLSQQGKHSTRPLAFIDEIRQTITEHIKSFRGRKSHYSLHDTRRLYLPEDLNVCKMHSLYQERHPEHSVSRESYRKVFVEKFNLSFGYLRKDTCSTCDGLAVKLEDANTPAPGLTQHLQERELHLRKAKIFYVRKAATHKMPKFRNVKLPSHLIMPKT